MDKNQTVPEIDQFLTLKKSVSTNAYTTMACKVKGMAIAYKCQNSVVSAFAAFVQLCISNEAKDMESVWQGNLTSAFDPKSEPFHFEKLVQDINTFIFKLYNYVITCQSKAYCVSIRTGKKKIFIPCFKSGGATTAQRNQSVSSFECKMPALTLLKLCMQVEQAVKICWASTEITPWPTLCVCRVSASNHMYTAVVLKNYHSLNNPDYNYNSNVVNAVQ